MNHGILKSISMLNNCQIFYSHRHHMLEQSNLLFTCLIHIEGSLRTITIITSCQMEVGSLRSQHNNKKYGERNVNEACRINLYPMANHGNYKSQSWVWHFLRPYFRNSWFIVYTICLANPSALGWSREIIQWSINAFSHKSWKSPWNYIPWLVKTLVGTLNLLSILSINAYATPSLLQFSNWHQLQPFGKMFNHN
jgi:hypothetical protein